MVTTHGIAHQPAKYLKMSLRRTPNEHFRNLGNISIWASGFDLEFQGHAKYISQGRILLHYICWWIPDIYQSVDRVMKSCTVKITNFCTGKNPTPYHPRIKGSKERLQQSALCCDGCRDVLMRKTKTPYSDIQIENDLLWGVILSLRKVEG